MRPSFWLRLTAVLGVAGTLVAVISGSAGLGAGHRVLAALALPPLAAVVAAAWVEHRRLLYPSIAALVARVIAKGFRDVFPFLLAMWIGEGIWLSLAVFGLAVVAQTFHFAFVVVKWVGVAYLAYLAWKMWTAPVEAREGEMPREDSPAKLFAAKPRFSGNCLPAAPRLHARGKLVTWTSMACVPDP